MPQRARQFLPRRRPREGVWSTGFCLSFEPSLVSTTVVLFRRISQIDDATDLLNARSLPFDGSGQFIGRAAEDALPARLNPGTNRGIAGHRLHVDGNPVAERRRHVAPAEQTCQTLNLHFRKADLCDSWN